MRKNWSKDSWQSFGRLQNPTWPDQEKLSSVKNELANLPALVFAGETRELKAKIAEASEGKSFILQVGDCAEEFANCHGPYVHRLVKLTLQMSAVLSVLPFEKIVKIGRIAGQYGKPRSNDFELMDGVEIPVFRGELVNSPDPVYEKRVPDTGRLLQGYFRSASTLNLLRAFYMGGYGKAEMISDWHSDFNYLSSLKEKFADAVNPSREKLNESSELHSYYTSHEALILDYEEPLVREDTTTGALYGTSAHFLWLGERTRSLDSPQVEFLRGIENPIGIKVGPTIDSTELIHLLDILNPIKDLGRISLITRLGAANVDNVLIDLVREVNKSGHPVTWICDPMHGNTVSTSFGVKTRRVSDITSELNKTLSALSTEGEFLGGVHLEITGDSVLECTDKFELDPEDSLYKSLVDPRLNPEQSLELMFRLVNSFSKINR